MTHVASLEPLGWQKIQIMKIQDGGGRHFDKSKYRHISAMV